MGETVCNVPIQGVSNSDFDGVSNILNNAVMTSSNGKISALLAICAGNSPVLDHLAMTPCYKLISE